MQFAFVMPDAQAAFDTVVGAGVERTLASERRPWVQVTAYLRNPDGLMIEIGEPHIA